VKNSSTEAADREFELGQQLELYVAEQIAREVPAKDDLTSMEYPLFSLSKRPDTRIREYSRGGKSLKIIPSVVGAANVFDKDILVYATTALTHANNLGVKTSPRMRIDVHDFLVATKRSTGGASYERILQTLRRLRGTTIETNIKTTDHERTRGFSMITDYEVTRATKNGQGVLEVIITIADWLYRQIAQYEVLTITDEYYALTQGIERRLYQLARKHVGDKAVWKIGIELLQEKCGSRQQRKFFMNELREIVDRDTLPDYRMLIDDTTANPMAVFFTRDSKRLLLELNRTHLLGWYSELTQKVVDRRERLGKKG
jgi:plasmid replication initiation protein